MGRRSRLVNTDSRMENMINGARASFHYLFLNEKGIKSAIDYQKILQNYRGEDMRYYRLGEILMYLSVLSAGTSAIYYAKETLGLF